MKTPTPEENAKQADKMLSVLNDITNDAVKKVMTELPPELWAHCLFRTAMNQMVLVSELLTNPTGVMAIFEAYAKGMEATAGKEPNKTMIPQICDAMKLCEEPIRADTALYNAAKSTPGTRPIHAVSVVRGQVQ